MRSSAVPRRLLAEDATEGKVLVILGFIRKYVFGHSDNQNYSHVHLVFVHSF